MYTQYVYIKEFRKGVSIWQNVQWKIHWQSFMCYDNPFYVFRDFILIDDDPAREKENEREWHGESSIKLRR